MLRVMTVFDVLYMAHFQRVSVLKLEVDGVPGVVRVASVAVIQQVLRVVFLIQTVTYQFLH